MNAAVSATEKSKAAILAVMSGATITPQKIDSIIVGAMGLSIAARDAERYAFLLQCEKVQGAPLSPEFEPALRECLREVQKYLKVLGGVLNE